MKYSYLCDDSDEQCHGAEEGLDGNRMYRGGDVSVKRKRREKKA